MECKDTSTYKDGWHGGYIEIQGQKFCDDSWSGSEKKEQVTITGKCEVGNITIIIMTESKILQSLLNCFYNIIFLNLQGDVILVATDIAHQVSHIQNFRFQDYTKGNN